jgi:hypothetical protein
LPELPLDDPSYRPRVDVECLFLGLEPPYRCPELSHDPRDEDADEDDSLDPELLLEDPREEWVYDDVDDTPHPELLDEDCPEEELPLQPRGSPLHPLIS